RGAARVLLLHQRGAGLAVVDAEVALIAVDDARAPLAFEIEYGAACRRRAVERLRLPDVSRSGLPDHVAALRGDADFGEAVAVEVRDSRRATHVRLVGAVRVRAGRQRNRIQQDSTRPVVDAQDPPAGHRELRVL